MEIAILLYYQLTALDAVGPYEVLSRLTGARIRTVAVEPGPKRTDAGLEIVAAYDLDEVVDPDVVVVPGGPGTRTVIHVPEILRWLRNVHETTRWTTSVCTGSLILGAAGLLRGLKATTHWSQMEGLREFGAEPVSDRVVCDGKIVTAAGVTAGIDMALWLAEQLEGEAAAQAIQLRLQYDPEPPFNAGSPEKAAPEIIELARSAIQRHMAK